VHLSRERQKLSVQKNTIACKKQRIQNTYPFSEEQNIKEMLERNGKRKHKEGCASKLQYPTPNTISDSQFISLALRCSLIYDILRLVMCPS
jgi:hypothetical protein